MTQLKRIRVFLSTIFFGSLAYTLFSVYAMDLCVPILLGKHADQIIDQSDIIAFGSLLLMLGFTFENKSLQPCSSMKNSYQSHMMIYMFKPFIHMLLSDCFELCQVLQYLVRLLCLFLRINDVHHHPFHRIKSLKILNFP